MKIKSDSPVMYKNVAVSIRTVNEDGTFSGYGSTFGGEPDSYGDIVAKGAFKESLKDGGRNGNGIAMLWQHNSDIPIGVWTLIREDEKGLYVEGQLALETKSGHDAYILMKMGAIKGMSIGFQVIDSADEKVDGKFITTLTKLNLWEISLVTFPANTNATIDSVKAIDALKMASNEREFERVLRDAGVPKKLSVYLASLNKQILRDSELEDDREELLEVSKTLDGLNLKS